MPKITLTYVFEDLAELMAYMDGIATTRAAEPVVTAVEPVVTAVEPVEAEPEEAERAAEPVEANTDADGLPYDPEIHATPKSLTADGLWRSKRGKAKEAEAARAAFKASGGGVVTPTMPTMPGLAPTMPAVAPPPISYDRLLDKTLGMMQRSKITADQVMALYGEIGIADPAALETNETMRAALFGKLCDIEPELA